MGREARTLQEEVSDLVFGSSQIPTGGDRLKVY